MTEALDAMVKAMAIAMARHDALERDGRYDEDSWLHMSDDYREGYLTRADVAARAGLAAIRRGMTGSDYIALGKSLNEPGATCGVIFQAAIDKIMEKPPAPETARSTASTPHQVHRR